VTALEIEDLVLIASRTLGLDVGQVLDLLDVAAAERALAQARPAGDPAADATALLHALLRQQPLRLGNRQFALAAMLQFLALNGQDLDPGAPEPVAAMVTQLAAGTLGTKDVADWLAPRLRPSDPTAATIKEAPMPEDTFGRFTDRARRAVILAQTRPGSWATTPSAPGMSCSACWPSATASPPRYWSRWTSRWKKRGTGSGRSSAAPRARPRARSRSPRRPGSCRKGHCARHSGSDTTTSAPSTCYLPCSPRASLPRCWPPGAPILPGSGNGCWTCWPGRSSRQARSPGQSACPSRPALPTPLSSTRRCATSSTAFARWPASTASTRTAARRELPETRLPHRRQPAHARTGTSGSHPG